MSGTATATMPAAPPRPAAAGRLRAAVGWELVLVAVLLLVLSGRIAGFVVAALLVAVAIALGMPFGGLTGWQRLTRRWRFNRRARPVAVDPGLPDDLVPLGQWVPGLAVSQTRSASGDDVGVITDGSSWTALLGIASDDALVADRDDYIDLTALRGLTVQDDIVFAALQVVTYTVPAPAQVMLLPDSPVARSYLEIIGPATPPAVRRTWIGVRLDPRICLEAITSRGASIDGIHATLRFGLHRVQSALKRQGIVTHALTALEVNEVLVLTTGASPDQQQDRSRESWLHWHCDGFAHCGRQITGWGDDPSAGYQVLLDALDSARIVFGVSSYTLDRTDAAVGGVRLVAPTVDAASAAASALQAALAGQLDFGPPGGDQVPALLGTVPLGRRMQP